MAISATPPLVASSGHSAADPKNSTASDLVANARTRLPAS